MEISANDKFLFTGTIAGLIVFERDRDTGTLKQLEGEDGCLTSSGEDGCKKTPGMTRGVNDVQVSGDGRHVYASGDHLLVFNLNRRTGRLTLVQELDRPAGNIALSPDERNLYAMELGTISVYRRDPMSGFLERLPGAAGCVAHPSVAGCYRGVIRWGSSVAISPDGRHAYVTSLNPGSLAVFERDAETGALQQIRSPGGCFHATGKRGCVRMDEVREAKDVTISPDGRNVYLAAIGGAVTVFARDEETGTLTRIDGLRGCDYYRGQPGCTPGLGLYVQQIILSPDGRNAYTSGYQGLAAFSRSEE